MPMRKPSRKPLKAKARPASASKGKAGAKGKKGKKGGKSPKGSGKKSPKKKSSPGPVDINPFGGLPPGGPPLSSPIGAPPAGGDLGGLPPELIAALLGQSEGGGFPM